MSFFSKDETIATQLDAYIATGYSKADLVVGTAPGEGDALLNDQAYECYLRMEDCKDEDEYEQALSDFEKAVQLCGDLCVAPDQKFLDEGIQHYRLVQG
jgi:hypothetical protein